jgi:hypothetical protein
MEMIRVILLKFAVFTHGKSHFGTKPDLGIGSLLVSYRNTLMPGLSTGVLP